MKLPNDIKSCHILLEELFAQVAILTKIVERGEILIKAQSDKIKELEVRLNQNSQNSSKPPSSDFNKPPKKRRPGIPREIKKKGGQIGHKGDTLKMVKEADVDDVIKLNPIRCNCGKRLKRQQMQLHSRRQQFDIPDPKLFITEYQQLSCTCPSCGQINYGKYPEDIKAPVQYGVGVKSLVTLLSVKCHLSYQNINGLFVDLFGQTINGATIQFAIEKSSIQSEATITYIKNKLLESAVSHLDETGYRVKQSKYWLHVMSNGLWTFLYTHKSRGKKAIKEELPDIYDYTGTIIHDSWQTYWNIKSAKHGLCGSHILRELTALVEQNSKWAKQMFDLILGLYKKNVKEELINRNSLEWKEYKRICLAALEEEPPPVKGERGKPKKTKGLNLAERLMKYQEAVLRFARESNVPFTNNQAERDLRPTKGKMKVAGCFRSVAGARHYARLQSVFSTWRKQDYNIFQELKTILNGGIPTFLAETT